MAIASPYAVFRAVDLIWPPSASGAASPAHEPSPLLARSLAGPAPRARPRKRRAQDLIQGDLFASALQLL